MTPSLPSVSALRNRLAAALLLLCPALTAAEVAVLQTGFRLKADKVECAGLTCVLHIGSGRTEVASAMVASVEFEPDDPKPDAAPAAPTASGPDMKAKSPRELIDEFAQRNGLPPEIVHSVAAVESAYKTNAISPKGAIGVMQLMPGTAKQLNANPHDPVQNIAAGTTLLRDLLIKYENDPNPVRRALAAYNAGPGAVSRFGGVPPYRETQAYVEKVLERYWKLVKARKPEPQRFLE